MDYATVNDITVLFRPMTAEETLKAEAMIPIVCDRLRMEARRSGKDLDEMITKDRPLLSVAKQVTVDVVARALMSSTEPGQGVMSQMSESALGYTVSGTFMNPGGGLFIKKEELRTLGIRRQKVGVIHLD